MLGHYCYQHLEQVEGVTVHTPRTDSAGLIHFSLDGISAEEVTGKLYECGIIVRTIPDTCITRVSTGFYNSEQEIDQMIETVKAMRMSKNG